MSRIKRNVHYLLEDILSYEPMLIVFRCLDVGDFYQFNSEVYVKTGSNTAFNFNYNEHRNVDPSITCCLLDATIEIDYVESEV